MSTTIRSQTWSSPLSDGAVLAALGIVLATTAWKATAVLQWIAFVAFGLVMMWIVAGDLARKPATEVGIVSAGVGAMAILVANSMVTDGASPLPRAFAAGAVMAIVLTGFHLLHKEGFERRNIPLGITVAVFVGSLSWAAVWLTFSLAAVLAGAMTGFLVLRRDQPATVLLPTSPFFAISSFVALIVFG